MASLGLIDVILPVLRELDEYFKDDNIFEDAKRFVSALYDVKPAQEHKKIRNLLRIAICDINGYSRLKKAFNENNMFAKENIAAELSNDFNIPIDVAREVVESIALLIGFTPTARPPRRQEENKSTKQSKMPTARPSAASRHTESVPNGFSKVQPQKNGIYKFAGHDWLVLYVHNNKALLLLERVWDCRPYNRHGGSITWEHCTLREELRSRFYDQLRFFDRVRIIKTSVLSSRNPWYGADGGNITDDHVFLLSLEEAVRHFGDSGMLKKGTDPSGRERDYSTAYVHGIDETGFHDRYSEKRMAKYKYDTPQSWWLRSPGYSNNEATFVYFNGRVDMIGASVSENGVGVRPALWIKL